MRRRVPEVKAEQLLPPHLAEFTPADWPEPSEWWSADLGVRNYKRMKWQRARRLWRLGERRP